MTWHCLLMSSSQTLEHSFANTNHKTSTKIMINLPTEDMQHLGTTTNIIPKRIVSCNCGNIFTVVHCCSLVFFTYVYYHENVFMS